MAEFAREPAQSLHHRARAPGGEGVDFPAPGGLVAAFERVQRALQAFDQQPAFFLGIHRDAHQAVAVRRSKILPSFSSRVWAVNGLMM